MNYWLAAVHRSTYSRSQCRHTAAWNALEVRCRHDLSFPVPQDSPLDLGAFCNVPMLGDTYPVYVPQLYAVYSRHISHVNGH